MYSLFAGIVQLLKKNNANIDNTVFKLHYKFTASLLISFSIILTARQLVGDPISCVGAKNTDVPEKVLNDYCWIQTTYTLFKEIPLNEISPGVGPSSEEDKFTHHKYYQWVCLVFFIQSLFFYLPKYMWTAMEGHLIKSLIANVNSPVVEQEVKEKRLTQLKTCFMRRRHRGYVYKFVVCEILNLINVIGQIIFLDYFLQGEFSTYGLKVLELSEMNSNDRRDPMDLVFPKLAKCTFKYFGPSGTEQNIEGLCVLPLNIVNEKLFVFLWIWFYLLLIITTFHLIYRFIVISSKTVRFFTLKTRVPFGKRSLAKTLSDYLDYGDWFVLCQLSQNVYAGIFEEIMESIQDEIPGKVLHSLETEEKSKSTKTSYNIVYI